MSTGEATILLELDKVRGKVWDAVERTGWNRFLTLTKMLHRSKAEYTIEFEFVPRTGFLPVNGTIHLCDGDQLKAHIVWVLL